MARSKLNGDQLGTTGGAWTTWTPAWTNLTVGNGTTTARYIQRGKSVIADLYLLFGTTTSVSGTVAIDFPVAAAARYGTSGNHHIVGQALLTDEGTAIFNAYINCLNSTTTGTLYVMTAGGTYVGQSGVTGTVPHTWANTDKISLQLIYEAA